MAKKTMSAGIEWRNVRVKLGALKPWGHNPRMSSKKQAARILESFSAFGQVQTVAIGPGFDVYDGHQRLSALLTLHGKDYEIDCRQSSRNLSDDERRKLVIALHAGAQGAWDWDALSSWDESLLTSAGMDAELLEQMNRDAIALREMLSAADGGASDTDAEPQIDKADELREKWKTARGQIWQLGAHRLMCGDSTSAEDVARLMASRIPHVIFSDPPYGISIVAANVTVGGGEAYSIPFGGVKNRRLGSVGAAKPFGSRHVRGPNVAANVVDVGKYAPIIGDETTDTAKASLSLLLSKYPKAVHVWWGANYYSDAVKPSPCWLVWNKETTGNFADCELAWTNQDKAAKLFTHKWNGMLRDSERGKRMHPTQKPAALAKWVFSEFNAEGLALDPFAGCGTLIIAGEQIGLPVYAMEMSEDYIAIILQRWADATGKTPALVESP